MITLPPILIVSDRGHFIADRFQDGSVVEVLDHQDFSEGPDKISELVTNQAGRFASRGTDGYHHSAAERPTMVMELENRCVRHIAEAITTVLTTHRGSWALAAPGGINQPVVDHPTGGLQKRLHPAYQKTWGTSTDGNSMPFFKDPGACLMRRLFNRITI